MKLRWTGSAGSVEHDATGEGERAPGLASVRDGRVAWVSAFGETYRIESVTTRPGARGADIEHALVAPMPGKITKLHVAEGDPVTKGMALLVLEAMKMEHEIRAPKDGTVRKLNVVLNGMVGMGDCLAELE
ncbi:MAG: acetyl-CoA carboxylase biotin carboxyl carrier protein subunit [Thermoanaerobaculia bacterium]